MLVVGIWIVIGFSPWAISLYPTTGTVCEFNRPGVFGDSFGFVNALFSGLALAGVIVAIFLQRKELFEQRNQLYYQYQELLESVKTQQDSQKALESQAASNQVAAVLNLVQHYGASERFDKDPYPDLRMGHEPTPAAATFYKRAALKLTHATHDYVLKSLDSLEGFSVPNSYKFLYDDLAIRGLLDRFEMVLRNHSWEPKRILEILQKMNSSVVLEHPRLDNEQQSQIVIDLDDTIASVENCPSGTLSHEVRKQIKNVVELVKKSCLMDLGTLEKYT